MDLIEGFVRDNVFIDFGSEIIYGDDQVYDTHPCRFATVQFALMPTNGLVQIADRIRKDLGFRPMHPMDEYTEETCDNDGWYDLYVSISDCGGCCVDSCIEVVVVNADSPDNEETYHIDLDDQERIWIYDSLDEQCRRYLGKGCAELLREARAQMEELSEQGFTDYVFKPEDISSDGNSRDA